MQNEDTAITCENSSQQSLSQPECHSIASDDVALLRSQLAEQQRELDRLTVECEQLSSENNSGRVTLQELETRYDTMVDGALQGIIIHQDSVICFANQSAARIFDYANPDELLGRDFFELLVIPDERLGLRARTETLYRGGVHPSLANWRALSRDGRERWVTTTARLLAWGGRPAAVVFFQDITEERRAVQTLQEREALLHSITDHTDDIIFIKDRDSRILFLNPAGFRTSGLSPSKALGHTDAELFPDQALAAAYRTRLSSIRGVTLLDCEPGAVQHIFPVRVRPERRAAIRVALSEAGYETRVHYKPNHFLRKFADGGTRAVAESLYQELLTLPTHADVGDKDVEEIARVLEKHAGTGAHPARPGGA